MDKNLYFGVNAKYTGAPAMRQMDADLRRVRKQIDVTTLASKRFGEVFGGSTWRRQVQQAGMQISDISVQIAGGQSAILAFTQNIPQLAQNFGALGGAAAAIITIFGSAWYASSRMAESIKNITEETDETTSALGKYYDALKAVDPMAYKLFERTSEAMKATSREAKGLLELSQRGALLEFAQDAESLSKAFSESVSMKFLKETNQELAEFLGLDLRVKRSTFFNGQRGSDVMAIDPRIVEVAARFRDIEESKTATVEEQVAAYEAARDLIVQILGGTQNLTNAQVTVLTALEQQLVVLKEFDATQMSQMDRLRERWSQVSGAAREYYTRLSIAAQDAFADQQETIAAISDIVGDTTVAAEAFATVMRSDANPAVEDVLASAERLKDEFGGAEFHLKTMAGVIPSIDFSPAIRQAMQLRQELGMSVQMALRLMGVIGAAAQAGRVTEEQLDPRSPAYDESIAKLERIRESMSQIKHQTEITGGKFPKVSGRGGGGGRKAPKEVVREELTEIEKMFRQTEETVSQSMLGSFKSLLDGTKSLGESVRDILGSILDRVIDLLMTPIFNSIAGNILGRPGSGGILGGLAGLGATFPSFEGGGSTGPGTRTGGVDGRGGRFAIVHPNETINDNYRGQGRGGVVINFNVSTPNAESFAASRRQIEQRLAAAVQRGMMA